MPSTFSFVFAAFIPSKMVLSSWVSGAKPKEPSKDCTSATLSYIGTFISSSKTLFSRGSTALSTSSSPTLEAIPAMAIKNRITTKIMATKVPRIEAKKFRKKFMSYLFYKDTFFIAVKKSAVYASIDWEVLV